MVELDGGWRCFRPTPMLYFGLMLAGLCTITSCSSEVTPVRFAGRLDERPYFSSSEGQNSRRTAAEERDESGIMQYEALFSSLGRSLLEPRQDTSDATQLLKNNRKSTATLKPGDTQHFKFSSDEIAHSSSAGKPTVPASVGQDGTNPDSTKNLELRRRQTEAREIFISLSVCQQPTPSSSDIDGPPPALDLYISSSDSCSAGPDSKDSSQTKLTTEEGFVKHSASTSNDLCVAVRAPDSSGYSGSYSFEVAVSIDAYYADYHDYDSLFLLDSDSRAGLFVSTNLTDPHQTDQSAIERWLDSGSPFSIFIHNKNDTSVKGLTNSFCGLNNTAQIKGLVSVDDGLNLNMTTIGDPNGVQTAVQQFYVPELNSSSSYYAFLGLSSNYSKSGSNSPTAGGSVWKAIEFDTKTYDNCQLIYNLSFCSSVAYAVPSDNKTKLADLRQTYDDYAKSFFENFTFSLAQIPCDTEREAQYSLATTCTNCSAAYTKWLCAVTIPRCADYTSTSDWLQLRNVGQKLPNGQIPAPLDDQSSLGSNSSRNRWIDEVIQPGPYKEVMPCGELCHGLVQACPASLGFACPRNDARGKFNKSYGEHGGDPKNPHCNFPGAIWGVNGSKQAPQPPLLLALTATAITYAFIYIHVGG